MTLKGYFPHKLPDLIPSNFGFAFVLGKLGINTDPNFEASWQKVKHIRRGIYQRPIVNATDDAFKHSSYLIELCQYYNPAWNDMPLLLNILVPNIDLTFISVWLDRVITELKPKERPLLFTTPKHWNVNLQGGPNSEVVSKTILTNADIICSQYNRALPEELLYVDKVKYWEYSNGLIQYAPDGVFEPIAPPVVVIPPPADEDPPPPPVIDPLAKEVTIHLNCPKCKNQIF